MFFVRVGNVVAWLALVLGASRLGLGLLVASQNDPEDRAFWAARYLGKTTSSGEAINQGVMVIVLAIGLGILVHIGRSVGQRS